jgi:hypothetical protein
LLAILLAVSNQAEEYYIILYSTEGMRHALPSNESAPGADSLPSSTSSGQAGTITDRDLKLKSQELGLLGKVFGSKENAPVNIVGFLLFVCVAGMILGPLIPFKEGFGLGDFEKTFGALIVSCLTFLGGYLGGKHSQ